MPTISVFFGIVIQMFANEHPPPHFHATKVELEVIVEIRTLKVVHGSLDPRDHRRVLKWAEAHQDALLANWYLCRAHIRPLQIPPHA